MTALGFGRVVVSTSVPLLKDGLMGSLTSFSLLDAGQRLFTMTTIVLRPPTAAAVFAALGFDTGSSCQQVPHVSVLPDAAPNRFWDTAALYPGVLKKPQETEAALQLGEPLPSSSPYLGWISGVDDQVGRVGKFGNSLGWGEK